MEVLPIISKIFANVLESGKQGILKHLGGGNGSSESGHRSGSDCSQRSTRHPPKTMREPHNGQNPVPEEIMGGSDQTE
jgi:hypothetical protein